MATAEQVELLRAWLAAVEAVGEAALSLAAASAALDAARESRRDIERRLAAAFGPCGARLVAVGDRVVKVHVSRDAGWCVVVPVEVET